MVSTLCYEMKVDMKYHMKHEHETESNQKKNPKKNGRNVNPTLTISLNVVSEFESGDD